MSETPRDILREALQERRPLTEDLLESYEARMARAVWLTPEERLANVARVVIEYTEIERMHNGRGKRPIYAADATAIRDSGRQLAEMVLGYLDGALEALPSSAGEEEPF